VVETRPLELSDRELGRVADLLGVAFGSPGHLDVGYLDWCYRRSPRGRAIGRNAWRGDLLVAHYVTVPLRARLFGEERSGVLSLHTATHPESRGRGLFTRLAEDTYADAAAAGADFVLGVANAASTPGFVGKLGFQLVAPLDVRVGLGAPPAGGAASEVELERAWSQEELAWRLACPARGYRRGASGGGVTIYAPTGRFGIWIELARRPASECRLGSALARLPGLGVRNPIRMWMGLDPDRDWSGQPWPRLPARLRPSPLNLIYRDLRTPGRRLDAGHVRFAAIDFDAY